MRPDGFVHSTGLYGSEEEFVRLVIPFLAHGLEAGEPVTAAFTENNQNLVREVFGDRVSYVDARNQYDCPAGTIRRSRELFAEHVAAGARQIRIAGDVPADQVRGAWDWWARYEAAVNDLYNEFPVWSMCASNQAFSCPVRGVGVPRDTFRGGASIPPGAVATTRIPCSAHSQANDAVSAFTPPLAAE